MNDDEKKRQARKLLGFASAYGASHSKVRSMIDYITSSPQEFQVTSKVHDELMLETSKSFMDAILEDVTGRFYVLLPDELTGRREKISWGKTLLGSKFPGPLWLNRGNGAEVYWAECRYDARVDWWSSQYNRYENGMYEVHPKGEWTLLTQEALHLHELEAELADSAIEAKRSSLPVGNIPFQHPPGRGKSTLFQAMALKARKQHFATMEVDFSSLEMRVMAQLEGKK